MCDLGLKWTKNKILNPQFVEQHYLFLLILLNVNTWSLSRLKPTFLFHIRFREVVSILEPLEPIENVSGKHKLLLEYFFFQVFKDRAMKNQNGFFYRNVMVLDKNFPSHVTTTEYIGAVALNLGFHFVDKILAERQDGFFIDFFIGYEIWKVL